MDSEEQPGRGAPEPPKRQRVDWGELVRGLSSDAGDSLVDAARSSPGSWALIGICLLFFLVLNGLRIEELSLQLTFAPSLGLVFPGIVTHMFLHQNFAHLFFNMFMVYMIGSVVERGYGTWPYLIVYGLSGLVGALAQIAFEPTAVLLGASGAVAGILAVFIRHLPTAQLYVFGIIPMPAWLLGVLWLGYNIFGAFFSHDNIAYAAHVGGFVTGFLLSIILSPPRGL
jgi:membrane associated rhomboid family serine protease